MIMDLQTVWQRIHIVKILFCFHAALSSDKTNGDSLSFCNKILLEWKHLLQAAAHWALKWMQMWKTECETSGCWQSHFNDFTDLHAEWLADIIASRYTFPWKHLAETQMHLMVTDCHWVFFFFIKALNTASISPQLDVPKTRHSH